MGRRRSRQPDIFELIGPLVALVFLVLLAIAGFNLTVFAGFLQGLIALMVFGVMLVAVGCRRIER